MSVFGKLMEEFHSFTSHSQDEMDTKWKMEVSTYEEKEEHLPLSGINATPISSVALAQIETPLSKVKQCYKEVVEQVQANLDPRFPSFVKTVFPSHITDQRLKLPIQFCNLHLPKHDCTLTLTDECQKDFITQFKVLKNRLSGWMHFCKSHELVEGDTLIFQLVEQTKFQVYIIRASPLSATRMALTPPTLVLCPKSVGSICATGGALVPPTLGPCPKSVGSNDIMTSEPTSRKRHRSDLSAALQPLKELKFGSDSEEGRGLEIQDINFQKNKVDFKDVKNLESFSIVVNDLIIDSALTAKERSKYYDLCCTQGTFLHENLLKGLNLIFIAGAICQTIELADSIKSCKITTSLYDLEVWVNSLEALERIGMNVGFLSARLQRLMDIILDASVDSKQLDEAQSKRARVEKELDSVDIEISTLKSKTTIQELKFQSEVDSPW